jgi:ATP-dependent RNA helicase DeaD
VPEADVAAALAVVLHGGKPLLLEDEPVRPQRTTDGKAPGGDKGRPPAEGFATYRIEVGKRHKVQPRQIVGALANEGGLSRRDFGNISIRPDFSLVELPADLSQRTQDALKSTRISGKLIELKPDRGSHGRPNRGRAGGNKRGKY